MRNKKISLTLLTIITIVVSQLFFLTILNDISMSDRLLVQSALFLTFEKMGNYER
ncbi:Uncharacterised protein [Enterococcus faecium]|nr:hypothetical protein EDAG_05708 [Enterococcus faecium D344SRF]EQV61379.1 hypothetical protein EFZG_03928 [Enterococcus faecium TC 6]RBS55233.1 hypothetical protein EB27_01440 [Enterococcus faecium]RBS60175.1 hypothetical protein EB33_00674 [Enterococcus faecium]RBT21350.1 hypothetical protein EA97_00926 [Enterococcus faecium]